ncbi:unnamed protein product [Penicillium salamii]|nr:unnamed protein product [Penicillium salamii]CAG8221850.1 unnamed protein product [Penicillium salamii]CAG8392949.1 unnamed protein product [Penicillium salamii]
MNPWKQIKTRPTLDRVVEIVDLRSIGRPVHGAFHTNGCIVVEQNAYLRAYEPSHRALSPMYI